MNCSNRAGGLAGRSRTVDSRYGNLADPLAWHAQAAPDKLAVIHPGGPLTYGELDARVWQSAGCLYAQGVKPGDVVTPAFEDEAASLIVALALFRLGATVFSVPPGSAGTALGRELSRAGVAAIVATRPVGGPTGLRTIALDPMQPDPVGSAIDRSIRVSTPLAPALLVSGSGTTGRSKLIPLGHQVYLERLIRTFLRDPVEDDDRVLSRVRFEHVSCKQTVLAGLYHGAAIVFADHRAMSFVQACASLQATVVWTSVGHLEMALDQLARQCSGPAGAPPQAGQAGPVAPLLPGLRELYVGGSTVGEPLRKRAMAQLSARLHVRYGANECGVIAIATPEQIARRPGTVGRPWDDLQLEVVDADGQPLVPGETGEVRIRGPGLFGGYRDDAQASARVLRDGWFHPGDLAIRAPDGQLIHCGRADDLMISGGINIHPAEIEWALGRHPAVREIAAFPVPARIEQQVPVCAVILHEGASVGETELQAYARDLLGARSPRHVTILSDFPRTAQGKIDRRALRDQVQARLAAPAVRAPASGGIDRIQIGFRCPSPERLTAMQAWFAEWLQIEVGGAGAVVGADGGEQAQCFLGHGLALAMQLLQSAGVPAFERPGVETCQPVPGESGRWRAVIVPERIETIDPECQELALHNALQACTAMAGQPRSDAAQAAVNAGMARAIQQIGARVRAGKSTIPVLRAARQCGIPFLPVGAGLYQLGWGSKGVRIQRSATGGDSALGAQLVQSKSAAAAVLRGAGLPVPAHGLARQREDARSLARRLGWPVVVKPDDRDRGEGVAVDVDSDERLLAAFDAALACTTSRQVIVERQVPGVCHRLFIAAGRLLYGVRRLPKSVIGDGSSTVAELIQQANRRERSLPVWARSEPYPDDEAAQAALAAAGYSLQAVPPAGRPVPLRRIESTAAGGYDEDVTETTHPANVEIAVRAAALTGLEVAGVDIISTDITVPWYRNGAVINELNFAPLLGGGEISRRHISEYLARIVGGDGRIPVEVVVDHSNGLREARRRQQAWRERPLPFTTLAQRWRAVLLDRAVDALVLGVDSTDELAGLPVAAGSVPGMR